MMTRYFLGLVLVAALSACKTDDMTSDVSVPTTPDQVVSNSSPVIFGSPASSTRVGGVYLFQPAVNDPNGDSLSFAVVNKPAWANFNISTGALSGTPQVGQIGNYFGISISVTDGHVSAALPSFAIVVTAATESPTIAGSPSKSVLVGNAYSFTPVASDPNGQALTFSVENLPSWAAFDEASGQLSGTPDSGDVGTFADVRISVSNGTASESLPAFTIAVNQSANGTATLSWMPPAQNTDGSPLTNLAGYHVYYGTSASSLTKSIRISNSSVSTYVVTNLTPATWYFSVKAFTSANVESDFSAKVSKSIM